MWYCARNLGSCGLRVQHGLIYPSNHESSNHLWWHQLQYSGAVMAALHGPNPVMLREMVVRCENMCWINKEIDESEVEWSWVKILEAIHIKSIRVARNTNILQIIKTLSKVQVMQPLLTPSNISRLNLSSEGSSIKKLLWRMAWQSGRMLSSRHCCQVQ